MKVFGIAFFLSLVFFFQCEKGASDAQVDKNAGKIVSVESPTERNVNNMNEFSSTGTMDDIKYRINGRLQKKGQYEGINYPNDNIVVEYELKNSGAKDFILYDRGHSSDNGAFVYVEPLADGTVELSLKAFTEPAGKNCPARFAAVMPRASWLRAGETVKDRVYIELPLKTKTPFDDCTPKTEVPPDASKVKFCLGFQEAAKETKIAADGNVAPRPEIAGQQFLCSEVFTIKN